MKRTVYIDTIQPATQPPDAALRSLGSVQVSAPDAGRVIRTVQIPSPARFEDWVQSIQSLQAVLRISGKTGIVIAVEFIDDQP